MQISSRFTMAIHMFACIDTFSDTKPSCLVYFGTTINETILAIRRLWV